MTGWPRRSFWILLAGIVGVGLLARLLIVASDIELLIAKVLPDDAFYYFGVARHIAAGQGVTFDGRTLTNGFHPLWMLLLIPLYLLAAGDQPIRLALILATLFDLGTTTLIFTTIRRETGRAPAGLLSAAFFWLNPALILETLNGLETALSLFTFMAVFAFYCRRFRCLWPASPDGGAQPHPTVGDYLLLGALAGLMCLARTDSVFLIVFIGLSLLWRGRRWVVGRLLAGAATGAALLAPWFLWSWLTLGTPWQSSGSAMPTILRHWYAMAIQEGSLSGGKALSYFLGGAVRSAALAFWYYAGMALLVMIIGLGVWRVVRSRLPAGRFRDLLSPLLPYLLPGAAVALTLLIHTLYRWYPRSWYFAPAALVCALPVGPVLTTIWERAHGALRRPAWWAAALFLLVAGVFLAQGIKAWRGGVYPWQAGFLAGARWAEAHTTPDDVLGAFNAGILGYFSRRETVNLDGVTDPAAQRALRQRQTATYAQERRLRYVIDYSEYVEDMYRPFYGRPTSSWLRPLRTVSQDDARYGAVIVYAVIAEP